jgi:glycosyltransferase involved in cell wall biosynthesis
MITSRPEPATDAPEARWKSRGHVMMVIRLLNGRAGGAERLFCDVSNLFSDAGYDVTVVTCDSSDKPINYRLSPKITKLNLYGRPARRAPWYLALDSLAKAYPKVPLLAPADWLAKNLYFVRRLHAVARDVKPDVMISFMPPANTPTLIAGWLAGAKTMPTNHNVPVHDYQSKIRWDQNPIDKALRLAALRTATKVHVLFPTFGAWFPEHLQDKIVAIPNAVSPDFLTPQPARPRKKEIVGVGRLTDVKNYVELIEAWALLADRFPDWSVKIYGHGPQRKLLQARIDELGLGRVVHLMGNSNAIKDVYLESEILAHPAQFEGFGLSVAEALACGVPVVAYADCPGVNEFVHDGDNGVMVDRAGGAKAFAAGLERLITDEPLRLRLRARGPASLAGFSPEIFRDNWLRVVEEIVS